MENQHNRAFGYFFNFPVRNIFGRHGCYCKKEQENASNMTRPLYDVYNDEFNDDSVHFHYRHVVALLVAPRAKSVWHPGDAVTDTSGDR